MNRNITVAICSGVVLVALGSLWLTFKTETVQIPQQEIIGTQTGLGQVLGEETAKSVPDHGRIVVVTVASLSQLKQHSNYLWATFESELLKHNLSITAAEIAFNAWNGASPPADRAAFTALLERHANADALVFFVDLPNWLNVAEAFPQARGPKIIAIDNLQRHMKSRYGGYFVNGMLVALIGARSQPVTGSVSQPKTPREWFDRSYQSYTAQNYESLPE